MRVKSCLLAIGFLIALPMGAFAQAGVSGLVRDASGAVLPGVTVEAASPVLIEKARSAVSDAAGRYTISDLRPGTYRVTFTLPGFKTVVRDGVELAGTQVVTVNADLAIGGVEETITVSGETPAVDLQTTTRQAVMDQEIVSAIPSSRTPFTVGVLIPGVKKGAFTGQDVGGSVVQEVASLEANGGRTSDQRMMVNGVALSSMIAGGWGGGAVPNATGTSRVRHRRVGRGRAGGHRRRAHQLHPARRRQPLQRHHPLQLRQQRHDERQLHRHRRAGARSLGPGQHQGERRLQPRVRRADRQGQAVVLPVGPQALCRQLRGEHVLQPERERHQPLRLRAVAEPGDPPPGADDLSGADHLAGLAEKQDRQHATTRRGSVPVRRASGPGPEAPSPRRKRASIAAFRCSASSPSTGARR